MPVPILVPQRVQQADLAAPSILAPEVSGCPDLLTQTGCPLLLTLAQGRKVPHKHLTAASVFCSGSGPGGPNSNKPPLESVCWRWGRGLEGEATAPWEDKLTRGFLWQ